jgi:hypothetical protein
VTLGSARLTIEGMAEADPGEFITPKLVGARFEGGVIPLEVLADLAGLSELLIETAKWKFLQKNPGRKRSPRGFTKGVELKLTEIKDGSAIPVIALSFATTAGSLFPPESATYLPEARDAIVSAIDAAANKKPIELAEHLLAYFDRVGRNLGPEEAIEFPNNGQQHPARLNKATRRALVLASQSVDELTDPTQVQGLVPEADQSRKTFQLQLADGRKITGPLTAQHRLELIEAFNAYTNRQRVLIDCIGRFNRNNRLVGIETIEQVTLLDPLDISARLDELRSLEVGWLQGDGVALAAEGLDRLGEAFSSYFPDKTTPPHLYPTPEGNISAEWSLPPYEVSLKIDLASMKGNLHALKLDDDAEFSEDLDLAQKDGWHALVNFIGTLPGGQL